MNIKGREAVSDGRSLVRAERLHYLITGLPVKHMNYSGSLRKDFLLLFRDIFTDSALSLLVCGWTKEITFGKC